jgi:hypothetical protein
VCIPVDVRLELYLTYTSKDRIADIRFDGANGIGPYAYGPRKCEKYAGTGGRTLLNGTHHRLE